MNNKLLKKASVELIGTFIFLGVIITVVNDKKSLNNWLKIGLALSIVIVLFGSISGGNFNPAVSFMLFMNKQLTSVELLVYIIAQLLGGLLAYLYFINLVNNKTKN